MGEREVIVSRRELLASEALYVFKTHRQIEAQTGFIGVLRCDFNGIGDELCCSWQKGARSDMEEEFKAERDVVIAKLQEDVFKTRDGLIAYCKEHGSSLLSSSEMEAGFRVDTEKHSYLFRLSPRSQNSSAYCYCYVRKWLDDHLWNAQRGIRFITPSYYELYRLEDGDRICIMRDDKIDAIYTCLYVDDYHVIIGNTLYHICQFAEIVERNGYKVEPLRKSLPLYCLSVVAGSGTLVRITLGKKGYQVLSGYGDGDANRKYADQENQRLGVSRAQEEAMKAGSEYGWGAPSANPDNYDAFGNYLGCKTKN